MKNFITGIFCLNMMSALMGQSIHIRILGRLDFCEGGSTTLDAGANYATYHWSTGASTRFLYLQAGGNYSVTVTDTLGNSGSASVTVTERPNPMPVISGNVYKCPNRPTALDAGSGYEFYQWSTGATGQTISVLEIATYSVTVTDEYGCKGVADKTIVAGTPVLLNIPNEIRLCGDDTASLDARVPGALSYLWEDNSNDSIRIVQDSGIYNVIVTNGECVGYDTCRVYKIPPPTVELGNDTIICMGENVPINASVWGVTDYQWSDGGNGALRTIWQEGQYQLTIRFGKCFHRDSINVYIFDKNDGQVLDTIICESWVYLKPQLRGAETYRWSTGADTSTILVKRPGVYKVSMSNGRCNADWTYQLDFKQKPNLDLGKDTVVCLENAKHLTLKADWYGSKIKWQDSSTFSTFVAEYPGGTYKVRVSNECGVQIDSMYVGFHECHSIFVPNVFTPNDDNINDYLQVYPTSVVQHIHYFRIFNRAGNLVYACSDFLPLDAPLHTWNGQFVGKDMRPDVYVYTLEFTDMAGKVWQQSGNITLVR